MPLPGQIKLSKRHGRILAIVREQGTATITGLARQLDVSAESIRRDVRPLTRSGALIRGHGAVALPWQVAEAPFERRMREQAAEKKAIARAAARHIENGQSIMLDAGTTTSILARELLSKRQLTVVTNSSDIARALATVNDNTVYMAGGELHGDNGAAFGATAIEFLSRFRVRHAIISIGAIDEKDGPMDHRFAEAEVARVILKRGETAMMVSDHSKYGRTGVVQVAPFDAIARLISNAAPPPAVMALLKGAGTKLELAEMAGAERNAGCEKTGTGGQELP